MDPFTIIFLILAFIAILSKINKRNSSSTTTTSSGSGSLAIQDEYHTIEEVQEALRKTGLESCNLIIGIDYTKSNEEQGRQTFNGRCLHHLSEGNDILNPYEKVVSIVGRTLEKFDDDKLIPTFGFGDETTRDVAVFPFRPNDQDRPCFGVDEVLKEYRRITPYVRLSGPTNFAPIIDKAVEVVMEGGRGQYHILVIIADGLVVNEKETEEAIVRASDYPLSIIMVGVGDGPFDLMEDYDDGLPQRKFDNFQFVHWDEIARKARQNKASVDATFALHALMEIPQQYSAIKKLGLIGKKSPGFNPNVTNSIPQVNIRAPYATMYPPQSNTFM